MGKELNNPSNVSEKEIDNIWEQVKENYNKLNLCNLHQFGEIKLNLSRRYKCINCGGEMRIEDIRWYAKGFAAAEKNKSDIFTLKSKIK